MPMRTVLGFVAYVADTGAGKPTILKGAQGKVYSVNDVGLTTPLACRDLATEAVIPNPVSNEDGFIGGFKVSISEAASGILWVAGEYAIYQPFLGVQGEKGVKGDTGGASAAEVEAAALAAKNAAVQDASTKYGLLPAKVSAVESKNATQDTAIAEATWYKGGLAGNAPVNAPLGALKDGTHRASTDSRAYELGLPGGAGKLTQMSYGTFGIHTYTSMDGFAVRRWNGSSGWGAWKFPAEAYTDAAVAGISSGGTWFQGGLAGDAPVNAPLGALADGVHRASSDSRAFELNLPGGSAGMLTQMSYGSFGIHTYTSLAGLAVRIWDGVSAWGAWSFPANDYADTAGSGSGSGDTWYKGGLAASAPIGGPIGSMDDGDYRVTTSSRAIELGLPGGLPGNFKQVSYGTFALQTYTTIEGLSARQYSTAQGRWGDWVSSSSSGGAVSASGGPASGMKRVPLALTLGHGGSNHTPRNTNRLPMHWGAPISRFRVHIRNINPRENDVKTGVVTFEQGLYLGVDAGDGIATGLTQIVPPFTTPANGDGWASDWIERDLPADSKHLLSFSYDAYEAGGNVVSNVGGGWQSIGKVAATTAGTWEKVNMSPMDIWIEAETPATVPVVAVIGDSLSAGNGSTIPVHDSMLSQYMRAWGGLPIHYASAGDTFVSFNGRPSPVNSEYKKNRWLHLAAPDSVLIHMGSNDIFGNAADLETMKLRLPQTADWAKENLSSTVFLATITPRDMDTGVKEDIRRAYNVWLKAQAKPSGLALATFDFAAAVSSDDETIDTPYNSDGIHMTTAGYAAEVADCRPMTSPALVYRNA